MKVITSPQCGELNGCDPPQGWPRLYVILFKNVHRRSHRIYDCLRRHGYASAQHDS